MSTKKKTIVLGCGTGRCGTVSLTNLIAPCRNAIISHELRPLFPWVFNEKSLKRRLNYFLSAHVDFVGDVAFYYLPYLEAFLGNYPNTKVICMKRDKDATIDSYDKHIPVQRNHWRSEFAGTEWLPNAEWDKCFPSYGNDLDRRQSIGKYWEDYYGQIDVLCSLYSEHILVVELQSLNDVSQQDEIFDFIEMPSSDRVYMPSIDYNSPKLYR